MAWRYNGGAGGRPSLYTPELAEKICNLVATHPLGIPTLCQIYPELPAEDTIYSWIATRDQFSEMFWKAKSSQATCLADEILHVARTLESYEDKDGVKKIDSGMLGKAKLEIDALRWQAARLEPKRWADQKKVEEAQNDNARLQSELDMIRRQLDEKNKKDY